MTALAEKIAPASPASDDASERKTWLPKLAIRDLAYEIHEIGKQLHRDANRWHHAAEGDRQEDPAFVIIQLREIGKAVFAKANEIEKKIPIRQPTAG